MAKKAIKTVKEKAVKAVLEIAAAQGWEQVTLTGIAEKINIPLHELRDHFEDRYDILAALGRIIDKKVLENIGKPEAASSPRDTLFDILMERFDILNEDRDGVCAILKSFRCDPKQAVLNLPHLGRSMSWMLEAAGINTGGVKGSLKIIGLTGLYLKALRTWIEDESEDMGKTMAALDQSLDHAEQWAGSLGLSA